MDAEYTEQFIEEADKVKYIRKVKLLDNQTVDVEIYLTKNYLTDTDVDVAARYLNNAIAAVLTRGVPRLTAIADVTVEAEEPDANI